MVFYISAFESKRVAPLETGPHLSSYPTLSRDQLRLWAWWVGGLLSYLRFFSSSPNFGALYTILEWVLPLRLQSDLLNSHMRCQAGVHLFTWAILCSN